MICSDAGVLLLAGGVISLHQFRCLLDVGTSFFQHLAGFLRYPDGRAGQLIDFAGRFWLRSASLRTSAATTRTPSRVRPREPLHRGVERQQVGLRAISSMMEILLAISFMAETASSTHLPLACASLAELVAILSVCWALSAFC